jgi:ribonuclease HI
VIYTDGSCLGNGSANARGAYGIYFGPYCSWNFGGLLPLQARQSNNSAEIVAITEALLSANRHNHSQVEIRTDSKFLITCIQTLVPDWLRSGWKTSAGKPVINQLEFEELLKAMRGMVIRLVHVRGHSVEVGNDRADFLARLANLNRH